jgi:hypothetical protein
MIETTEEDIFNTIDAIREEVSGGFILGPKALDLCFEIARRSWLDNGAPRFTVGRISGYNSKHKEYEVLYRVLRSSEYRNKNPFESNYDHLYVAGCYDITKKFAYIVTSKKVKRSL